MATVAVTLTAITPRWLSVFAPVEGLAASGKSWRNRWEPPNHTVERWGIEVRTQQIEVYCSTVYCSTSARLSLKGNRVVLYHYGNRGITLMWLRHVPFSGTTLKNYHKENHASILHAHCTKPSRGYTCLTYFLDFLLKRVHFFTVCSDCWNSFRELFCQFVHLLRLSVDVDHFFIGL